MVSIPEALGRVTTGELDPRVRATWRGIVRWGLSFGIHLVDRSIDLTLDLNLFNQTGSRVELTYRRTL